MSHGELIRSITTDSIELQGFFVDNKSEIGILHIHGLSGNFYENLFIDIQMSIAKNYSFLSLNTRGHDYANDIISFKESTPKIVNIGGALEIFEDCIQDIDAGIKFLQDKGCKKIILQGHSTGCQKITYYQSIKNNPAIIGLVLLAPADDKNIIKQFLSDKFDGVFEQAKSLPRDSYLEKGLIGLPLISAGRFLSLTSDKSNEANVFDYDSEFSMFNSIKLPKLAIFGSKDIYLTKGAEVQLNILKNRSQAVTTVNIDNAPHNFRGFEEDLVKEILQWSDKLCQK